MPDISIVTPDGRSRIVPLQGERVGVGRANTNELCFPEDTGLSRQHLMFERDGDGDGWLLHDPGSKNGTYLNGERITGPKRLRPGDHISAGHLTIVFDPPSRTPAQHTVIFVDKEDSRPTGTVSTNLAQVLPSEKSPQASRTTVSADRVGALIRAGRELVTHRPLHELFPLILNLAIEAVHAERGVLLTVEGDSLVVQASSAGDFRISTGVRDRVLKEKASILVNDVQSDEAFRGMQSLVQQQVRMLLAVPLQTNETVIGLIYVDCPTLVREFDREDLNLLTVMANVAAIRIEHQRLAEIEHAERVLAKDLEQAAILQRQLLPATAPEVPGMQLAGYNAPCRTVGGDYYDFWSYPDGRVAIALGDVSGKAMPAALLMTSLQARVRVMAEEPPDVARLMTRLNRITTESCPSNRFISFFFSVLNPVSGELVYSNAGHNPPLLIRANGTVETLEGGGLILGVFGMAQYESRSCRFSPGDVLVLFSDGVTEALNPANEEFGDDRLVELLRRNRGRSAEEVISTVTEAVNVFAAGAPAADDLTLVVAKRIK
jgi:serine phosphatase RsbU (regulator of sigma subunit)/pSer/pThr/pTyr-binding forkhead associated (FHA) protein